MNQIIKFDKNGRMLKIFDSLGYKSDIDFKREVTFPNCKYIRLLPFDFYDSNTQSLTEADGIQHFRECLFTPGSHSRS